MDFYNDRKIQIIMVMFLVFIAGVVAYPIYSGLLMICSLLVFGSISLFWKEPNVKIGSMILLVLLAFANIGINGMKFGIDFSGGTRIPIILERSVDQETMNELVQTIKTRANVLGLSEVKVRAIGDSEINVELPTSDDNSINLIEQTLSHQGVYQGIVDGKVAVSGDHIFSATIQEASSSELLQSRADWGVTFSVDREGAEQFAKVAKGKNDYPVYMYLDRPQDAILIYDNTTFKGYIISDSTERETLKTIRSALKLENGKDIEVYSVSDIDSLSNITPKTNKTKVLVSNKFSVDMKNALKQKGFTITEIDDVKMAPELTRSQTGELRIGKLEAVGLLSAPTLSAGVTNGIPNYGYVVTGGTNGTTPQEKAINAQKEVKGLKAVLKGGSLPVQISIGSRTSLPASLGGEFLKLSLIGVAASLVAIAILIGLRYKHLSATYPIVLISLGELIILLSILGSFTIDLAAMAGIIAAIGVGVDAQIVITDEILKKDEEHTLHEKVGLAFGIIKTNALVAMFSMLPLLFSGLVEVIGFAISTILGALLGYMLTRPTYAAIVEKLLEREKKQQGQTQPTTS